MASAPEAFPDIRAEIPKAARVLVVRQLKARGLKAPALRMIRDVIGTESFALIADGMTDAEVKAVVARLDPHHPTLKEATPGWTRRRLAALAAGDAPLRRGEAARPEPATPAAPPARALGSRPFAATWDGVDHDAPVKAPVKAKDADKETKAAGKKERKDAEKKKGKKKKD